MPKTKKQKTCPHIGIFLDATTPLGVNDRAVWAVTVRTRYGVHLEFLPLGHGINAKCRKCGGFMSWTPPSVCHSFHDPKILALIP